MAWVNITGSGNRWQYENTATISNTYKDSADGSNVAISGGIRTYTKPGGGTTQTYIRTRVMGQVNLLKKSENLVSGSGYWNTTRVALTKGFRAPDGSLNASSVIPSTDDNTHR